MQLFYRQISQEAALDTKKQVIALAKRAGKSIDRDKVLVANEQAFQAKKRQIELNNQPTMKERT